MKLFSRFIILWIILLLGNDLSYGYNLRQITNKDNLSNSSILSLFQDQQGILWIGTCNGLNKYDSKLVTPYQSEDYSKLLSGNYIENILGTHEDILWIQTIYGLDKLDRRKNEVEHFNEFSKNTHIAQDTNHILFVISQDSCIHYYSAQENCFKNIALPEIASKDILKLYIDSFNQLWIFTQQFQPYCYQIQTTSNGHIQLKNKTSYRHSCHLVSCFLDDHTLFFIDENGHLYKLHPENRTATHISNLKQQIQTYGTITSIVKFHENYFIGFKTNGLLILKETLSGFTNENISINCGVLCLKKDLYQDLVWIGTDGQGIYCYSNANYSIRSTLLSDFTLNVGHPITAIYWDKERTLWLGSKGDGILKIKNYSPEKNTKEYQTEYLTTETSKLNNNAIYSFGKSKKEILWIGTEQGVNYYSYKHKIILKPQIIDKDKRLAIHDIYEQDSLLWLATDHGILKVNLTWIGELPLLKISNHITLDEGNSNFFYSIYVENDSTLQFANRGEGMITVHIENSGLGRTIFDRNILNEVYAVDQDKNKNYIVGTSSGLIQHHVNTTTYNLTNKMHGFPNDVIHSLLKENDTTFWLGTNRGLINYNSENHAFRTYNYNDGLSVIEFSDATAYKDEQTGTLLFGGINGFVSVVKSNYPVQKYMPAIHFNELVIFGNTHNIHDFISEDSRTLTLGHRQNFFSISFSAIDYLNGNNYDYLYKLDEIDQRWINNRNNNSISFTNFNPGEYTLSVKYHNRVTNEESPVYQLHIHILPPWYQTIWAYCLYFFILLSTIILVINTYRRRSQKKRDQAIQILEQQHKEDVYESKLRFFTNIAHEFCTPLTLIYGPCNRILSQANISRPIIHYTKIIQQNAERLNNLIQDLIKFRSIESGFLQPQIEELEISALITQACEAFSDMADSRNIKFIQDVPSGLTWNSDKEFITTITSNFISNAFKNTPDYGEVKIKVWNETNHLYLTISNKGESIKKEEFFKIFDRHKILENFENQGYSGIGARNRLGIAISYHMITLLEGSIDIQNTENAGTDFEIQIPNAVLNQKQVQSNYLSETLTFQNENTPLLSLPQYTFDETKSTLLIVAAEPEILWFLGDLFTEEFNILISTNPQEAWKNLNKTQIDMILCDVLLSESDGISFTYELKATETTAHIPLILISAKQEVEEQIRGINAGAEMYIGKPFNIDYLKISVKQLIEKKKTLKDYFSSPISAFELENGKFIHKENKQLIKNILSIIDKQITNKELSVDFIAGELNMSSRNLYRKIGEIGDISIAGMIRDCRLHVAEDLLIKSKLTIDEIIFKSGFANRVSFFKAFARKNGCTPKEYRDQNKIMC